MTYEKPKNVTYTQMAIFIDEHAYDENPTTELNNLIFEYIYHLVEMLAYKAKFFSRYSYYDEFAIYVASSVYMRLRNPRQFQYDANGNPKLKRVKSILNYIKTILYPKKVDFEQEQYDQTFSNSDAIPIDSDIGIQYSFADSLIDSLDDITKVNFNVCLGQICDTIKSYIYDLPFKKDKVITLNIYLSCLLSFLSSITLKTSELVRIKNFKLEQHRNYDLEGLLENNFTQDDVILYHLSDQYRQYIFILTKKIKHIIANDLSIILNDQVMSQSVMKSIMINDIIDKGINQGEE